MDSIDFAIVHHANQFLITNGYQNREGLDDVIASYHKILKLHRVYNIPLNIHLSGTLLEAILWHSPDFFDDIRALREEGLIDFVGSSYGQNLMRFFRYHHNFRQLNEELRLYRDHMGIDPKEVKVFWSMTGCSIRKTMACRPETNSTRVACIVPPVSTPAVSIRGKDSSLCRSLPT